MSKESSHPKTLVCIFAVLSGEKADRRIFDRLEEYYLTNRERDGNILFAVFADLPDSKKRTSDMDETLISYAEARIRTLSETYGNVFSLFIRNRRRSESEDSYIGKERERGARLELCRFLRGSSSGFALKLCEESMLHEVKYLFAIHADILLPIGAVKTLAEMLSRPENQPVSDRDAPFVTKGHAMLKLAQKPSFSPFESTPFSVLMKKTASRFAPSILDVDVFLSVCDGFFPKEACLDADIIEDFLLRAKTVTELELPCQTTKTAASHYERLHRRICSDLQMLPYLGAHIRNEKNEERKNPLSCEAKKQLLFRCLCHFVPLLAVILLFISVCLRNTGLFLLILTAYGFYAAWQTKSSIQTVFAIATLAYDAYLSADVGIRTGYRFFISGKHFLKRERISEAHVYLDDYILRFSPSMMLGILFFCGHGMLTKILGILWMLLPFVLWKLSKEYARKLCLCARDREALMRYTRDAWCFFRDEVNTETHGLPPDHKQISPLCEARLSTSPSSIGLYLLSLLSARDLGLITTDELAKRSRETAETLETLFKWNGHLYRSYSLETLAPGGEAFISTEESGIFVTSLITFCEGAREYLHEAPSLSETIQNLTAILEDTDFSTLYDETQKLFYVGYRASKGEYTDAHETLFMSKSCLASYYAIASGSVSREHEETLLKYRAGIYGIASEKGTAEESFLSSLFIPTAPHSIRARADRMAYRAQKKQTVRRTLFGKQYQLFGVSESGCFAFDGAMRYRSNPFGVAKTALCPHQNEAVIAPYASFLMLRFAPEHVLENLAKLKSLGLYGRYGFYESLDLESSRVGKGYAKIETYLAKHLGMSILSSVNLLQNGLMQRRFMNHPAMRAVCGLFDEIDSSRLMPRPKACPVKRDEPPVILPKEASIGNYAYTLLHPEMAMVSNHKTRILASSSGHIAMENGKHPLFRSSFDRYSLHDEFHVYVKIDGLLFPTVPLSEAAKGFSSQFSFHPKAERILYRSRHTNGKKLYDISLCFAVLPNRELCELTCEINGAFERASIVLICRPNMANHVYYPDEEVLLFSQGRKKAADREQQLGIRLLPHRRNEPDFDGIVESGELDMKHNQALIRLGMNEDIDELLYDLTTTEIPNKRQYLTENLLRLQYHASGLSERALPLERFFLRSFIFGQIRPRTESFSSIDKTVFSRYSISREHTIVLAKAYVNSTQMRSRVRELLGLFKFMCIRGIRYELIIGYQEREWILKEVRLAGCEHFLSWSCGIFLIDMTTLTPHERFSLELTAAVSVDLSYSLYRLASENARALSLSREAEALLTRNPATGLLPMEKSQLGNGIVIQKDENAIPEVHILSSAVFGTILTESSLGFSFVRSEGMTNLTAPLSMTKRETASERLILRLYDNTGSRRFRDYDLCAVSAWTEHEKSSVSYYGKAAHIAFTVSVRLFGTEPVKCIRMTAESGEKTRAALIFSVSPMLGETKAARRFYRFSKLADEIRIQRLDDGGRCAELAVFSPDASVLYTDSAALRSDGKLFLGESDIAAVVSRVELCEKKSICFYLAAVFSEKQYRAMREHLFHDEERAAVNPYFHMLDLRAYERGGFVSFRSLFDARCRLQDAMIYLDIAPEISKRILYGVASHQYEDGDLQKWYHPTGAGMRGRRHEDALWFLLVAARYVLQTQDDLFLEAKICYLSSPRLVKEEYERYEDMVRTDYRESMWVHILRALRYAKAALSFADVGELLFFLQALEELENLADILKKDIPLHKEMKEMLLKKLTF